jgi:spore coat polysaccharide biosynthesis protein SpsF
MNLAIIQARLGSLRLPGKVLEPIGTKSVLELVISRLRRAKSINQIIVATSHEKSDDYLAAYCDMLGIPVVRGSESNVYSRFQRAIQDFSPTNVLRVTADCPLVDPELIDKLWEKFYEDNLDYCAIATGAAMAKTHLNRFPDGFDAEWIHSDVLLRLGSKMLNKRDLEHVTSYIWSHPSEYKLGNLFADRDLGSIRVTLDTAEDLNFLRKVQMILGTRFEFANFSEVIEVIESNLKVEQAQLMPEPYNEFYGE